MPAPDTWRPNLPRFLVRQLRTIALSSPCAAPTGTKASSSHSISLTRSSAQNSGLGEPRWRAQGCKLWVPALRRMSVVLGDVTFSNDPSSPSPTPRLSSTGPHNGSTGRPMTSRKSLPARHRGRAARLDRRAGERRRWVIRCLHRVVGGGRLGGVPPSCSLELRAGMRRR